MSKTTKITAELEIKALLSDAQAGLEAFSRSLQSTWKNGEPPKSILKLYEQLGQKLTSMQETSKKGIVDSSELSQVTADYKAFQKILHELGVNFKLLSAEQKKALLSKEEQDAMKARADAVSKYNEVLKKNQEIRSKRQAPEGQIAQAKTARTAAEGKKEDIAAKIDKQNSSIPKKAAEIEAYKAAQDSLVGVLEKVKKTEEAIANERARGTPEGEGRNNSLTRALKNLEILKQQAADLEATSGKEAYEEYTKAMKEHEDALAKLQQEYAEADNAIKEANETIAQAEKKLSGLNVADESEAFDTLKTALQKLGVEGIESADNIEDLTSAIKKCDKKAYDFADQGIQEVIDQSDKLQKSMEEVGDELDKTNASMDRQKQVAADNSAFEEKIKQFLGLSGAAQLLRSAMRDAMATITELDATMTEMAVVTDLTVGDYWSQLPQYSKQASDLGVSINSAYKAATLYYQQGLKGNEVTKISAETLKLAKIAGIDAADATNKMTAALRGFNMELNEASAQRVADVYSELAAITAADVDEISNAMTKTASIAHSAGMEFETTAAFLSQIVETTRESAETAGTALKTVIARFQELKKDPGEIGEVDGEIVDANKIETALRTVGVALRDSSGQFRDLDDVFMDLSKKWDGLDKNTQRYIATIAAGSRQQSRFIAMMSDYERTQELVTAANTSAGASNKQFEKTMESLEAKVEKLKNAWHEFTMGILQSDLVKFGVDVLTKLLEVINKATSAFGGFGSSISKIGAILTTFKIGKSLFEKIPQSFKQAMVDVIREAIEGGRKAGEGAVEAAREGAENAKRGKKGGKPEEGAAGTKKTFGEALTELKTTSKKDLAKQVGKSALNATGIGGIIGGFKTGAEQREKQRQLNIWDKNGGRETLETVQQGTAKALETTTQDRDAAKTKFDTASATLTQLEQEEERLNSQNPTKKKDKKKLKKDKDKLEAKKKDAAKNKNDAEEEYKKTEEAQKAAAKANEQATEDLQAYDDLQKEVAENGGAGWKQVANGFSKLGSAATGAGLAVTAVGQAFIDAGAEEFGGALQKVGSVLTFIGTASSLVSAAMSILPAIFSATGAAGAASGTATSIAWSPVTIIVLAIVAALALLLVGFLAISAIMKSFSAEEKLKEAEAAADAAAEAADHAAESFNALNDAIESLDDKYKSLDDLIKGTKEWNEAVQEINASVLDLIDKYPELAGFVESKGGVLKIDLASDEVQAVVSKYENSATIAKASQYAAEARVTEMNQAVNFSNLGAVNEVSQHRGFETGAGIAALSATTRNPYIIIGGLIAGAILGPIENAATHTDKALQEATEALAMEYSENSDMTLSEMEEFLIQQGVAADEAAIMAEAFAEDTTALLEFGEQTKATTAALEAQYKAMAMQAQQTLDLTKYSEEEQAQMLNIVDEGRMEFLQEKRIEALREEWSGSNSAEFEQRKLTYAREIYGADVKIDGNDILDAAGNVIREFDSEEEFAYAIASTEATKQAAEAMEKIPALIDAAAEKFGNVIKDTPDGTKIVEKAFTDASKLSNSELQSFKESLQPEALRAYWQENEKTLTALYGSFSTFIKETIKIVNDQEEAWKDIKESANKLGFDTVNNKSIISDMSAQAANTWINLVETALPGNQEDSADFLNQKLGEVLAGKTQEEVDLIISQLGSIDITNAAHWDNLGYTLQEMGLISDATSDSFIGFVQEAKRVTHAIEKIEFSTFNQQINQTINLIKKINEGARSYSEDDYKAFVGANNSIKNDFVQIGDEFVYLGSAIQDLTKAVQLNTVNKLDEANLLLDAQIGMAKMLTESSQATPNRSDEDSMRKWLLSTVYNFANQGYDVGNLGIPRLNLNTNIASLDKDTLKNMVDKVLQLKGQETLLTEQRDKQMRDSNIAAYTLNDWAFNAEQGMRSDSEWSDEHRDALLAQAIQLGVGEIYLQSYREASSKFSTTKDSSDIKGATEQLLLAMEAIGANEEKKEETDALKSLSDKIIEAIERQRQEEIDKLSELNDTIESTNQDLISKLSEQINQQRQQRDQEQQQKDLEDLYRKQAYLSMDTSGANALAMLDNQKAIEEAEQSYKDAMVDQALQNLSDANEEAAEQRERQIDLLQRQLDYEMDNGLIADQAALIITNSLKDISEGEVIANTELGHWMATEISKLGGLDKSAAETEWFDIINTAIQSIKPETQDKGSETTQDYTDFANNVVGLAWQSVTGNITGNTSEQGKTVNTDQVNNFSKEQASQITNEYVGQAKELYSKAYIHSDNPNDPDNINNQISALYNSYSQAMNSIGAGSEIIRGDVFKSRAGEYEGIQKNRVMVLGKDGGGWNYKNLKEGEEDYGFITVGKKSYKVYAQGNDTDAVKAFKDAHIEHDIGNGTYISYNGNYYFYKVDGEPYAFKILQDKGDWSKLPKYKSGGSVDFTGPAWLDGTKSRPEYILNSDQTERFFSLVDILEGFDTKNTGNATQGDNYYTIDIKVDQLANDYDVEQMANKIRRMIYEDATYRNVNTINLIR